MEANQVDRRTIWQTRLRAIEPAALLVDALLLRRVARTAQAVSMFSGRVPHSTVLVLSRERLLDLTTEVELGVQNSGELPEQVALLAWPGDEYEESVVARTIAGRLVHAWTHLCWLSLPRLPQCLRQRLWQLGQSEWEEILAVAAQDRWLARRVSEEELVYREFVAYWWELRLVYPERLPIWFPTLARQIERIDNVVSQDIDGRLWRERLRLAGLLPNSPDESHSGHAAVVSVQQELQEPHSACRQETVRMDFELPARTEDTLLALAVPDGPTNGASRHWNKIVRLVQRGNFVRAARLCWLYAQQAEPANRTWWQQQARCLIGQLADRLTNSLSSDGNDAEHFAAIKNAWHEALWPLLAPATSGLFTQEARLLYDLQRVCEDARRGLYVVDVAGWLRTWGQLAWRREQPFLQQFLILRHLRAALRRVPLCSLSGEARQSLSYLLESAVEQQEIRLRNAVAIPIRQVLEEVGLIPHNLAEQIEQERVVQTLADRIVETGHLNIGQLRDAISANQLKLRDLQGLGEWWNGDQLLAADKKLSLRLDGVYRRGEVYLRWFQRLSSIFFGTCLGRWFSLFVALPFGGAYLVLAGLDHILLHPLGHWLGVEISFSGLRGITLFGLFLLGVINFPQFREHVKRVLRGIGGVLRALFWDIPRWLMSLQILWYLWHWSGFVFFRRYLFLPLLLGLATYGYCWTLNTSRFWSVTSVTVASVSGLALTTTREGRILLATLADYFAWTLRYLSIEWIVLSFNWIVELFRSLVNSLEQVHYRMDEWLRYRGGQNRFQLAVKAVLSLFWSVIAYILRFTVYLLIEPQINPIKHFPVVTVSHKLLLATIPFFRDVVLLITGMEPTPANQAKAVALVTSVIWAIPGIFGFLAWELKENWRLYVANRAKRLLPLRIGSHGETIPQLLRPGAHSGTLRKLFRRWRRCYSDAAQVPPLLTTRRIEDQMHHIARAIESFFHRNFIFLLNRVPAWSGSLPEVAEVRLGVSTIQVVLRCEHVSSKQKEVETEDNSAVVTFSLQGGWIVARWEKSGWLAQLSSEQTEILRKALVGLYHWAGVEVVAEQLDNLVASIENFARNRVASQIVAQEAKVDDPVIILSAPAVQSKLAESADDLIILPTGKNTPVQSRFAYVAEGEKDLCLAWWLAWQGLHLYNMASPGQGVFYRWQDQDTIKPKRTNRWFEPGQSVWLSRLHSSDRAGEHNIPWPVLSPHHIWFAASSLSWDEWSAWWSRYDHHESQEQSNPFG